MTVVYPSWEVAVERNRSGTNIVNVTPSGSTQGGATEIPDGYEVTVATSVSGGGNSAIKLSASALVGDVVEVYNNGSSTLSVFPASGEAIGSSGTNTSVAISQDRGRSFRKTASGLWQALGRE
jgi:hypothetical protein